MITDTTHKPGELPKIPKYWKASVVWYLNLSLDKTRVHAVLDKLTNSTDGTLDSLS